jgi:hypothetical protein
MANTRPNIKMTIYTPQNTILYYGCYKFDALDHSDGFNVQGSTHFVDTGYYSTTNAVINESAKLEGVISLGMTPEQLKNAGRVELKVIPQNQCPTS